MAETENFYILYDLKQESIPDDGKWALRYEKFVKRVPARENTKLSEDESESKQGDGEGVKIWEDVRSSPLEEILVMDALNNEGMSRDEL